jgi:hypothetical protein
MEKGFPFNTVDALARYNDVCEASVDPLDIAIDEFNQDNLWCSLTDSQSPSSAQKVPVSILGFTLLLLSNTLLFN